MNKLITSLFILFTFPTFAQNHYLGVKGGVSWTNIVASDYLEDTSDRFGLTGGLTYQFEFERKFHLGIELLYVQRGFTNSLTLLSDVEYNILEGDYEFTSNYDYLSVPLKAGYSIGNKIRAFANIGVVPSILVNAESKAPRRGIFEESTADVTKDVTRFDLGALLEVGGRYSLTDYLILIASVEYQRHFIDISNKNYIGERAGIQNYGVIASIGLRYALKRTEPANK